MLNPYSCICMIIVKLSIWGNSDKFLFGVKLFQKLMFHYQK